MTNIDAHIVNDMARCYSEIYGCTDTEFILTRPAKAQDLDIKHAIRVFLMEKHNATHYEIAKAEALLCNDHKANNSKVYHSERVVKNVLNINRPAFMREMRKLVIDEQKPELYKIA